MRRPIIAYMDNRLPAQMLSRRDFLYPDADEQNVPEVLAYIHDTDVGTLNTLLRTRTPDAVVAFPYLSDVEKNFGCRALTNGRNGWRQGGGRCCRISWNGWRGKMFTPIHSVNYSDFDPSAASSAAEHSAEWAGSANRSLHDWCEAKGGSLRSFP